MSTTTKKRRPREMPQPVQPKAVVQNPCNKCGCEVPAGSAQLVETATYEYDRLCEPCYIAVWPSNVTFVFSYGIPAHIEKHMRSLPVLQRLTSWFRDAEPAVVYFEPRWKSDTVKWQYLWSEWERQRPARKPFSYRGRCGGGRIVVLVDNHGIETPESIEWITYHELGHLEQQRTAHMSDAAWDRENKNEGRNGYEWEDDAGHEADSEERHVNRVATAFMGGKEYARPWWRARVNAHLAGQPLPDPHA